MFLYISCSKTFDTHIIRSDDIGFPYVYRKKIGGSALTPNQHLPIYLQGSIALRHNTDPVLL